MNRHRLRFRFLGFKLVLGALCDVVSLQIPVDSAGMTGVGLESSFSGARLTPQVCNTGQ